MLMSCESILKVHLKNVCYSKIAILSQSLSRNRPTLDYDFSVTMSRQQFPRHQGMQAPDLH